MALELLTTVNVQEGLKELLDKAYSIRQNLNARVETPILEDGIKLFDTFLYSKTMNLYGGVNEDNRHRFKIDNAFDLNKIINADINFDSSIFIDEYTYLQSQGVEFIILHRNDIKEATAEYAIKTDKYEKIREQLNKGNYSPEEIEKAGGFKINEGLEPKKISTHDGWKELAVGKNKASYENYEEAFKFLKEKYVPKAQQNKCFPSGTGMVFFVYTDGDNYVAQPWSILNSSKGSCADGGGQFEDDGYFLKATTKSAAQY